MDTYPIQLLAVEVFELSIARNRSKDIPEDEETLLRLGTVHSDYDSEKKKIAVVVRAITPEDQVGAYKLTIEIVGYFDVDEARFQIDQIEHWAEHYAPFVLTPFLREHIYALTARAGFKPAILPLITIPTVPPTLPSPTSKALEALAETQS